jgi:hypothetical protein
LGVVHGGVWLGVEGTRRGVQSDGVSSKSCSIPGFLIVLIRLELELDGTLSKAR